MFLINQFGKKLTFSFALLFILFLLVMMGIALPLTPFDGMFSSMQKPIAIGLLFAVFAIFLISLWRGRCMRLRVENMTQIAVRFSKGDFTRNILSGGGDELSVLAETMNQMAKGLNRRITEIENERAKLQAILDNMDEGVIAVNAQRKILLVNRSAEKIFQISEKYSVKKALVEVVKNQVLDEIVEQSMKKAKTLAREIDILLPEEKVLKAHAVGIGGQANEVNSVLVIYDITQLRKLEKIRSEFVANVSHELKTPLTSIKGFIETLLEGALEDKEKREKFLQIMEEDTSRLSRLIDELLELSKIESKQERFNLTHLNLKQLIGSVVETLEPQIKEKKIIINNHFPDIQVRADSDKLRQVMVNLLDNAIKFNKEEGTITFDIQEIEDDFQVSVTDTGPGIPEEAIPRIFERFFTVDKARSREMGGTGLGLSIVKHIIENHGGSVSCQSQVGVGTTFSFTLPK